MKNSLGLIKKAIYSLVIDANNGLRGRTLFVGGIFFFLMTQSLMATGSIKGKVIDKESKEGLAGANIILTNTSLGASSDLDGNFVIHGVPAGDPTITISYIGYSSVTLQVTVADNTDARVEATLEPKAITGETVTVTAQAQGQIQAINQQLSSNKIVSVVSEARIQELPDFNAAAAISRLPGVSTLQSSGEANKVVIRGLAPQFNSVSVGGISLASTGSTSIGATSLPGLTSGSINQDRSVDLSMVSPYMIKSIQVYKSITPDMNANVIGGSVNMDLREAPSGFKTDLMWQSGYTKKSDTYDNYRVVGSISNRFFGDKLGVYVLLNAEKYDRDADNMTASYLGDADSHPDSITGFKPVQVQNVALQRHIETRKRYGGNLILDYVLKSGSIKIVNMFSRLNSNYQDHTVTLNYGAKTLEFGYRAGDRNTDIAMNALEFTYDLNVASVNLKAANTYSRNHEPNSVYYRFGQDIPFGQTPENVVPEILARQVVYQGDTASSLFNVNQFSADYKENDQTYKLDVKIPYHLKSAASGFFKIGGEYRYNLHTNDQNTPYISISGQAAQPTPDINNRVIDALLARYPSLQLRINRLAATNFTGTDSKLLSSFMDDRFGRMYWVTNPALLNEITHYLSTDPAFRATNSTGGWFEGIYQTLPNDYKYIEKYYATYLMTELNVGTRFTIVGGARFEEVKSFFNAYNMVDYRNQPPNQVYYPVSVHPWNHFWLPQVQAKYDLAEWSDIRYSYFQTLARPDYHQLSPHYNINYDYTQLYAGNPRLKPAQAYNHDYAITFHTEKLGLFTLGGFYKEIKNFTYYTEYKLYQWPNVLPAGYDSVGMYPLITPPVSDKTRLHTYINSPYKAYVRGLEVDYQTSFWYLPRPLNGTVLGINYTRIWSSAYYPYLKVRNFLDPTDPRGRRYIPGLIDSSRSGRLIYQPDDILNAYIGYDAGGFSGRISFVFQGNSVTYIGGIPEQDGYSRDYFRTDASARYIIPKWPRVQLFLDVSNINEQANISSQTTIGGFTNEQFYGLTVNLGVRYTI